MTSTAALAPDEASCARSGVLAAKVASSTKPGSRSSEDVLRLTRLVQSRGCFFACFSSEVLEEVCQSFEYCPRLANKRIYTEASPATHVYLIATGLVSLKDAHHKTTVPGGEADHPLDGPLSPGKMYHKSRSMRKRDAVASLAETGETKAEEEHTKVETKHTVGNRFRSAVASIKVARIAGHLIGVGVKDSLALAPALKGKDKKGRDRDGYETPPWLESPEPGSFVVPMKGSGRLGAPLSAVLQELAKRCPPGGGEKKDEFFNRDFQKFSKSVDAKLVDACASSSEPFEPFVDMNPLNLGVNRSLPEALQRKKVQASAELVEQEEQQEQSNQKQDKQLNVATFAIPTTATIGAGHMFGVQACMSQTPYDSNARALERCELLALSVEQFRSYIDKERRWRRTQRDQFLLSAIPSMQSLDSDKMQRLSECFRRSNHRRGTVLCWEGEARVGSSDHDAVQFLVKGGAHAFKARESAQSSTSHRPNPLLQRDVGSLIPGQIINGASQVLGIAEPLTVIVDSAEAVVLSATYADLARFGGSNLLESLRLAVQELHAWRDQRLIKQESAKASEDEASSLKLEVDFMQVTDVENMSVCGHDRVSSWLSEQRSCRPKPEQQEHDGLTRYEPLRGGPAFEGKRTVPVAPYMIDTFDYQYNQVALVRASHQASVEAQMAAVVENQAAVESLAELPSIDLIPPSEVRRSPSVADAIFWPSGTLGSNDFCRNDTMLLTDKDLPDGHFDCVPGLAHMVSSLYHGELPTRFPGLPRCDRLLEKRFSDGFGMDGERIDPLNIAALHAEKYCGRVNSSCRKSATAPTQAVCGGLDLPPWEESTDTLPTKPSTAPLPELPPLLPNSARMPTPRRWRQRNIRSKFAGPVPIDTSQLSRPVQPLSSCSLENPDTRVQMRTLMQSAEPEHCDFDAAAWEQNASTELSLTILPSTPGTPRHHSASADLAGMDFNSSMEAGGSMEEGSLMLTTSIDADAADPLAAGLSLAGVSTNVDETSIWDQMWSVIGGSSGSVFASQEDSQDLLVQRLQEEEAGVTAERLPITPPFSQSHRPVRKVYGRPGFFGQALMRPGPPVAADFTGGLPHAHRALKPKAREVLAKRALREASPLHVRSIERFIRSTA